MFQSEVFGHLFLCVQSKIFINGTECQHEPDTIFIVAYRANTNSAGQMRLVTIKNSLSDLRLMSCPILTWVHPHKGVIIPGFAPPHLQWQMVWPFSTQKNSPTERTKNLLPHLEDPHPVFVAGLECSGDGVAAGEGDGWGVGVRDVDEDHLGEDEIGGGSLGALCTAVHAELKSIKSDDEATFVSCHLTDDSRCFPSGDTTNIISSAKGRRRCPNQSRKIKNKPYKIQNSENSRI